MSLVENSSSDPLICEALQAQAEAIKDLDDAASRAYSNVVAMLSVVKAAQDIAAVQGEQEL